ncbi:MAG: hypothetical protein JRN52_02080 [Nitrososphaerota archaeon]|nr:hypothetical protein [Nitrososphaerota archaeon]
MSQSSAAELKQDNKPGMKKGLTILVQEALEDICNIPPMEEAPDLFVDWGDTEKFRVKTARGECAA